MSLVVGKKRGAKKNFALRQRVIEFVDAQGVVSFQRMREICSDVIVLELVRDGFLKKVRLSLHSRSGKQSTGAVKSIEVFGSYYMSQLVFYRSPLKLQLFLFNNLYEVSGDRPSGYVVGRLTRFIHDLGYPVMIDTSWAPRKKLIRGDLAGKTSEAL